MFLAGTNFALHYRALRGDWRAYLRDEEFRFYTALFLAGTAVVVWNTMTRGPEKPTITIFSGEEVVVELPAQDRAEVHVAAGERTIIGLPAGKESLIEVNPGSETKLNIAIGERVHSDEPVFRSLGQAIRYATFQVGSILTTTGYGNLRF
ncbi:MAG: hypothetical protein KatS3mg115_1909 [Candidatus Poribacteria bacterium]|nr:MAG: hypothetical protein KatS3mg115_1909 [Candidatus Poribacteria bacterium]